MIIVYSFTAAEILIVLGTYALLAKDNLIKKKIGLGIFTDDIHLLNSFSRKWLIYITTLETYPLITIAAVLTSALTRAYSLKHTIVNVVTKWTNLT
ncbi:MAG: hypothetical protein DRN71_06000 [Candidatus Nanohalarchaeota archaeon]|nr:MAG: hypothetical protein DRN71_06000 [Candidatus Nanohaloarchaeota archaeon]